MAQSALRVSDSFLNGPLREVAETLDDVMNSAEFDRRLDDLSALSDDQLAARGLARSGLARHVFSELSRQT